jgi:hypothetical protein
VYDNFFDNNKCPENIKKDDFIADNNSKITNASICTSNATDNKNILSNNVMDDNYCNEIMKEDLPENNFDVKDLELGPNVIMVDEKNDKKPEEHIESCEEVLKKQEEYPGMETNDKEINLGPNVEMVDDDQNLTQKSNTSENCENVQTVNNQNSNETFIGVNNSDFVNNINSEKCEEKVGDADDENGQTVEIWKGKDGKMFLKHNTPQSTCASM